MTTEPTRPLPETIEVELTPAERHEVARRLRPSATILHETIRAEGEVELHRSAAALGWSAFSAGLSMGFSLATMGLLRRFLPAATWRPLVVNVGYSVGFLIVILGRQQLFTENTLTPVLPLLHNRDRETGLRVLRLWSIVLAGNLLGAALFAAAAGDTAVFPTETRAAFREIAVEAMQGTFTLHLLRGVFSGWLIALMVWLLPSAETARVFIVFMLTYIIGLAGLSHVIAGSVETLYAVVTGATSFAAYLTRFFVPVLAGNLIGGISLVAAFTHAEIAAEQSDRRDNRRRANGGDSPGRRNRADQPR
jgi:formate/nitrite transporter FocA (FNT family)